MHSSIQIRKSLLSPNPTTQLQTAEAMGRNPSRFPHEMTAIVSALTLDKQINHMAEETVFLLMDAIEDHLNAMTQHTPQSQADLLYHVEECFDAFNEWGGDLENFEYGRRVMLLGSRLSLLKEHGSNGNRLMDILERLKQVDRITLDNLFQRWQGMVDENVEPLLAQVRD